MDTNTQSEDSVSKRQFFFFFLVKRVYSRRGYMKKAKQDNGTSKVSERTLLAQSHWESPETV